MNAMQDHIRNLAIQELRNMPSRCHVPRNHPSLERRDELVAIIERGTRDERYVEARNKLIPQAERIADSKSQRRGLDPFHDPEWVQDFLAAMDSLWKVSQGN